MAERSFKKEVEKLRAGAGEVFAGEGILAVTKALLQSGVSYVAGYQGSPISHLMDVLADASDIMRELGVHFESSASEATAAATLAASVNYPLRGAITFKATAGTNVASDPLSNLASGGVTGGALIIVGEDYGEGSSIMQERSHAFAMKSQIWLLDPRPNLPSIVRAVEKSFELSEASNTPVMLQMRIRACHMHGHFVAKDNVRPSFTLADAMNRPSRDISRIVLPPASFVHEDEKINQRWPAAVDFIRREKLNEFFGDSGADNGLVIQGGMYNTVIRALQLLDLADVEGNTEVPLYVMNVAYPLIDDELRGFCQDKRAVLMLEEGQPEFIEQEVNTSLRRVDMQTRVHGKDMLPRAGEYSTSVVLKALVKFFDLYRPELSASERLPRGVRAALAPRQVTIPVRKASAAEMAEAATAAAAIATAKAPDFKAPAVMTAPAPAVVTLNAPALDVHPRPPSFCTGCPERPIFTAMKLVERELGPHHISCDIGCHLFAILPPFSLGATTMGYGLGWAGASAFNTTEPARRTISVMGDGGFWHNGLTSGVGNAVFNKSDNVLVIIDNGYSAATGGQDILSSKARNADRVTNLPIEKAVRGVGVEWVRTITNTYGIGNMRDTLREALTTKTRGPKVIIAQSECMLNKQRRVKPLMRKWASEGKRVVRERFGVDSDTCTGDHSCIRLSGCPSLSVKDNPDPLRRDPVATVLDSCVGCGVCGEVAHAAVLCPSFYRAQIISNPTRMDKWAARIATAIIGRLQKRLATRELSYA
ncbi:thiamine pyrophosphate-dependent enzyme [Pseudoduganella namucuonensis]|uniref:Indolepyruvate ferredoxin oxidoreductase alpha subunit n=1 Tax=Pseudoduganella namucuonensis TaxID=1035707 RepID=A0A1I7LH45_9BURK|nr:indolepyruvate ferredoxin oxidoreductase subunit alpha [Pseudoduganella namucuonensis]SFV08973.1 indolepyruvate ferredoxin oxidoreductase alpha subunit [Pseudoduganella namucuonensis]